MAASVESFKERVKLSSSAVNQGLPRVISMSGEAGLSHLKRAPMPSTCSDAIESRILSDGSNEEDGKRTPEKKPMAPSEASSIVSFAKKSVPETSILGSGEEIGRSVSGRWTDLEHKAFLSGLNQYGREWKKVAACIPTRTPSQIRSHAQKYFDKLSKDQHESMTFERADNRMLAFETISSTRMPYHIGQQTSREYIETLNAIKENPSAAESRVGDVLCSLQERYIQLKIDLQRLKEAEASNECSDDVVSTPSIGPASAALEIEQRKLHKAAKARYEMKKMNPSPNRKGSTQIADLHCASVSLVSMPGSGGEFDSSEVIALSMLGRSFGKDNVNKGEDSNVDMQHPSKKQRQNDL